MKINLTKNQIISLIVATETFIKENHFKKNYQNKAIKQAHSILISNLGKYPSKKLKELN